MHAIECFTLNDNSWLIYLGGEGSNYEGDFADTEAIVDFLANSESMELPDKIEEVNANQLEKLIKEKTFVSVFFCKFIIFIFSISLSFLLYDKE